MREGRGIEDGWVVGGWLVLRLRISRGLMKDRVREGERYSERIYNGGEAE